MKTQLKQTLNGMLALCVAAALLPSELQAQTASDSATTSGGAATGTSGGMAGTSGGATSATNSGMGADARDSQHDKTDYGWIGLLGLLGLAGLMRKNHGHDHVGTTTTTAHRG